MRALFGTCASEGLMGPFQYMRMMVIFIFLAQGLLRTKLLQVGINFVGDGSNGKSFFINMLKMCLGDKMVNVESHVMYGNTSETNQQAIGLDDACFTYDADAAFAELGQFKKAVTDKEAPLKRRLFRGLDRTLRNYTTPILASNIPLRYVRNSKDDIVKNLLLFNKTFNSTKLMKMMMIIPTSSDPTNMSIMSKTRTIMTRTRMTNAQFLVVMD